MRLFATAPRHPRRRPCRRRRRVPAAPVPTAGWPPSRGHGSSEPSTLPPWINTSAARPAGPVQQQREQEEHDPEPDGRVGEVEVGWPVSNLDEVGHATQSDSVDQVADRPAGYCAERQDTEDATDVPPQRENTDRDNDDQRQRREQL